MWGRGSGRRSFKRRTSTSLVFDWDEEAYGEGSGAATGGYAFHFYLVSDCYLGLAPAGARGDKSYPPGGGGCIGRRGRVNICLLALLYFACLVFVCRSVFVFVCFFVCLFVCLIYVFGRTVRLEVGMR